MSNQVKKYEPEFYKKRRTYTRTYKGDANDSSVQAVVQGHVSKCPDLVTNDTAVQGYIINLLKECIDCGVDGFRFDAAKHIETEDDGEYASDYWKNITTSASSYYTQKTGNDLYIYGEILNNCGADRSYSSYTKYINVTDNRTGDAVLYNVTRGKASTATNAKYKSGVAASNAVLWAESHDTYEGSSGSSGFSNTADVSDENVVKAWAIVASRKDSTALFFARPGTALMGNISTDSTYKSTAVSEINKFHNLFVGQSEKLGSSGDIAYVARGTSGIVLSNCKGTNASVSISGTGLADGKYTDTVSGAEFTVANGVLTGSIGNTGVAVVYNGTTTPKAINSVESGSFRGDTMTLTLSLENATSGTYCLDDSTPVKFTGTTSIRIGSDYKPGETINLTVTATDGVKTSSMVYKYAKSTAQESGVYVFFNPANKKGWSAPYQVYIYDETTNKGTVYKNANWPGEAMTLDPATGYYYYEVPKSSSISADEDDENQAASDFDLSTSANTRVIISEKGEATDVTKGSAAEPTTKPVPSTQPTTAQPATEPSGNAVYGDVNGDGDITVVDATLVQKHVVQLETLSADKQILADVNGDNTISVVDATLIQKYVVQLKDWGRTGDVYQAEQPTTPEPTTAEPTTVKPTAQPTTKPADTYTLYFKTKLGWMTSDGVSLFAYDLDTGASYQFEQDTDAYPNVYTVEVPATVSNVSVYRSLSEVDEKPVGGDDGNVYNCWNATVSKTNNCITLSNDEAVSTAPYVPEQKPAFTLSRVYFDNSKAHYTDVYIYGWAESGLGNAAAHMNKIAGTDIWYYDFDTPLSPGSNCFLFKDTESTWETQTNDLTVADGKNCFRANPGSKSGGVWVSYSE